MLTYGDGVCDVDLQDPVPSLKRRIATVYRCSPAVPFRGTFDGDRGRLRREAPDGGLDQRRVPRATELSSITRRAMTAAWSSTRWSSSPPSASLPPPSRQLLAVHGHQVINGSWRAYGEGHAP